MSARSLARNATSLIALLGSLVGAAPRGAAELPAPAPALSASAAPAPSPAAPAPAPDDDVIAAQPICIASTVHSAGDLGPALLYRRTRLPDGRLAVGYYAFFSEERPWGNNWMTWSLVPALAIDLVYTRLLFVAPGLQRAAYGPGDVEGFRVIYEVGPDGRLTPERAVADDTRHRVAELDRAELFAIDPERITLVTNHWTHHLGTHGVRARDVVYRHCYEEGSIRPVTADVARRFNLDHRAWPAKL